MKSKIIIISFFAFSIIINMAVSQYWTDELMGKNYFEDADLLGQDYSVYIIDNGVNYNLQALGGGIGPSYKIKKGYNTVTGIENDVIAYVDNNDYLKFIADNSLFNVLVKLVFPFYLDKVMINQVRPL